MSKLPKAITEERSEFEQRLDKLYHGESDIFGDDFDDDNDEEGEQTQPVETASVFDAVIFASPAPHQDTELSELEALEAHIDSESQVQLPTGMQLPTDMQLTSGVQLPPGMSAENNGANIKPGETNGEPKVGEKFPENKVTFTLFFSADKMNAYIRASDYNKGKEADNRIPTSIIYDLLKERQVKYGIDDGAITEYCKGTALYKDLQVATGKRPVRGEDGSVEYFFSIDLRYAPKEREDGSVDYKELGLIRNIEAGEPLCHITLPTEGVEGIDVLGNTVKPIPGKPAVISCGKGVKISEDGLEYLAESNGMVELNKGVVEIKSIYTVQGDVGPATGNIRFNGAVTVMGSVFSDYSIFANGDIIVNGYVEASILNSTGNILINNGINGMKKGFLKADGNVTVKFAEMARIVAGGNFYCDYCINCDVRAGGAIMGKGKRASLLGGNYIAGTGIDANTMGSELNLAMDMQIIPDWINIRNLKIKPDERIRENNQQLTEYLKEYTKIKGSCDGIENEINKLTRKNKWDSPEESAAKKKRVITLMQQKVALKQELEAVSEKKSKVEAINNCEGCTIVVRKIIHTGVRITMGSASLRINGHLEKKTFIETDGMIEVLNIT